MKLFVIDEDQLKALVVVQRRLHSENRLSGDEMRDLGHTIESVVRVVQQLELPEDEGSCGTVKA